MVPTTHRSMIDSATDVFKRRKWLLILPFVLVSLVLTSLIMALPSLYRASTVVIFGQNEISESLVTSGDSSELEQRLEVVRQSILSRPQLQQLIEEFNLYPEMRQAFSPEVVVRRMRKDVTIQTQELRQPQWGENSTFAVTITYQGWEPELVADVTNALAARYQVENEGIRTRQASRTVAFLAEQLDEVELRFENQERLIEEYKTMHLGGLPQQEGMNLASLERINAELRLNGERQIQLMTRRNDMLLGVGREGAAAGGATGLVKLEQLKRQLSDLGTRYTDSYPDIIRVRGQIRDLERELAVESAGLESTESDAQYGTLIQTPAEMETEFTRLKDQETELRAAFAELQKRIENTPRVEQGLQQLTNDYNEIRELYLSLQKRYQDASLAESLQYQQSEQVRVLEYAIPPEFSTAPQRTRLILMVLVLAAGLAGGLVFIAEQQDRTFHSLDDIRSFTKLPVLGTIAKIDTSGDRVRVALRFLIMSLLFIALVIVLSLLAYNYGSNQGQYLIWMMS